MLADRPRAVAALTKIFLTEIEQHLLAASGGAPDAETPRASRPRLGGITFLHRFGSALNHHVHLHACVTDGVFVPAAAEAGLDAPPTFLPARPVTAADLAALTERVRRRVIRWFRLVRLLDAAAAADMLAWENKRVFRRRECPDHAPRPRRAKLFSESRASSPILCKAALRARAIVRDPRRRRPHHPHPLRAAQAQSRQLGRAGPRPEVHAAASQRLRRALTV
jgi:hypothetical protein